MQVKETFSENLKRGYEVTIPNQRIEDQMNVKLAALGQKAKIKGFREGKAPLDVIKKQYGNSVKGEVLEQVVNETSKQALEQENVTPAVPPKIEIKEFADGKDLSYLMEVELFPDVPEIDYSKISIEKYEIEHDEEDVNNSMQRLVDQSQDWQTKEGKAEEGDTVRIDFEGFIGNESFEGGKGEDISLTLGSMQFIPGFEDQLLGAKEGSSKTVNVTFPEEYHSEDLKGKDARFEVTIHEVLESVPAKLTDEFAKQFGVESVDELREKMKQQLDDDQEKFVRFKLKEKLFDQIYENYEFDIPESMLEVEFNSIWQQLQAEKARGVKTDLDTKSEKDVKKEYQDIAKRRVHLGIVLSTISKKENVEISQNDVVEAINEKAAGFPGQEEQVKEFYQKNPKAIEELAGPLLEEKVVDFMLNKIKITSKKTTMKQLLEEEEKSKSKEDKKASPKKGSKKEKSKKE